MHMYNQILLLVPSLATYLGAVRGIFLQNFSKG